MREGIGRRQGRRKAKTGGRSGIRRMWRGWAEDGRREEEEGRRERRGTRRRDEERISRQRRGVRGQYHRDGGERKLQEEEKSEIKPNKKMK